MSRARNLVLATCVSLLSLGLAYGVAAALATSSSPSPSGGNLVLRVGTTYDCDDLDPFIGYTGTAYEIYHLNYDLLVGYNTDLSPRPELAAQLPTKANGGISADGRTWTSRLARG